MFVISDKRIRIFIIHLSINSFINSFIHIHTW